ncbi:uncharacterized protein LOC127798403 [Diospyros lotus]|uniref:uncharacterized protein LOC127798403 n=1 Tax=Diospyros lotus TaxID=55363 RepID=UPI002250DDAE|nr:uncharacterized protein LOC127798403 [Diospyros lotus]
MVVRMMKWRPWPPLGLLPTKKFEVQIVVFRLEGLSVSQENRPGIQDFGRLVVEIKWKGSKSNGLSYLRRSVRRNYTKEEGLREDGIVEWNEEFRNVCSFGVHKEGFFHPWEVAFTVFNAVSQGHINKVPAFATASLNLADFVSVKEEKSLQISIPLCVHGQSVEGSPLICFSLSFLELSTGQGPSEIVHGSVASLPLAPSPEALSKEKDEVSALRTGLQKVKVITRYASVQREKKASHEEESSDGRSSVRSEGAEYNYQFDTDSPDDLNEGESEEGNEDFRIGNSVGYGSLPYTNFAGASFYSNANTSEDEDWIYYSNHRSHVGSFHAQDLTASVSDQYFSQSSKRSFLPWKRRKLSFRSPKGKGEPLLKKDYGEEGGDDIDFDRRQLSSSDESTLGLHKAKGDPTAASVSEFGDDNFAVGSWENKEVTSRDGCMKLRTQVFFASIDQRSEQAAGESACTALVAVIADWFHSNCDQMPIKSQLDSLIREGSLEWRNLCENVTYMERFPDKHFDLETVLQARIRPLCVVPEKSFIGFFHPEGLEEIEGFDFLHGAMSFDNIWDEISQFGSDNACNCDPLVYAVSWNDHFFVLKVEQDAYYIIDTLGERLYEGCNQAYVLKFDKDTTIRHLPKENQPADDKAADEKTQPEKPNEMTQPDNLKEALSDRSEIVIPNESGTSEDEETVVCKGKESCKEYIKSFLAAIPIRDLQVDCKKGLMASTHLHQRLQIEFHYLQCLQPAVAQFSSTEAPADALEISTLAVG